MEAETPLTASSLELLAVYYHHHKVNHLLFSLQPNSRDLYLFFSGRHLSLFVHQPQHLSTRIHIYHLYHYPHPVELALDFLTASSAFDALQYHKYFVFSLVMCSLDIYCIRTQLLLYYYLWISCDYLTADEACLMIDGIDEICLPVTAGMCMLTGIPCPFKQVYDNWIPDIRAYRCTCRKVGERIIT